MKRLVEKLLVLVGVPCLMPLKDQVVINGRRVTQLQPSARVKPLVQAVGEWRR